MMKIATVVSLVYFGSGPAASTSNSGASSKADEYVAKPLKAVTFVVDTKGNPSLKSISLSTIRKIYNCTLRNWKDVPGSNRTDQILPLAFWDKDEATQLLKKRIPNFEFGSCVTVVSGPDPSRTAFYAIGLTRPNTKGVAELYQGIAYLNYGPLRAGQTALAVSDDLHGKTPAPPVAPSEASVKKRSYALVR